MVDQEKNCFLENKQMCSRDGSSGGKYGLAKKTKATKAPQRGPGVAELEKILREQQMDNEMTISDRISCHVNPSSSLYLPPPPRPPPTPSSVQAQLSTHHYPQSIVRMNLCPSAATVPLAKAFVQHQHVEHPSNQRSYANFMPNQPDEEKILVGVKRPWPFSMTNASSPLPQCKYPSSVPTTSQAEQSNPCCNHSSWHSEHRNKISRKLNHPPTPSKENTQMYRADESALDGKILKLGPPVSPSLWMPSKTKETTVISDSSLHNDSLEEQCRESDTYGSLDQPPLYSFILPDKHTGGGGTILSLRHGRDEVRVQKVDLDLRL